MMANGPGVGMTRVGRGPALTSSAWYSASSRSRPPPATIMCDADAKADAFVLWQIRVPALHPALHGDGATDGIDDRGELDQQAIAGGLADASAVLVDERIDQFAAVGFESGEGVFLVGAHQPRIAGDVRAHDRRQTSLDPFLDQCLIP
jgi:hypothetical protein